MPLHLLLLLLLLPSAAVAVASKAHWSPSLALDFFPGDGNGAIAQLALTGANATSAGNISMRSPHARVQYHKPIHLAGFSFSTYFSFSLHPNPKSHAASLAFFLTPAAPSSPPPLALAVVFAAADPSHIRVQIHLAGETAVQTVPRRIPKQLHSWIDYNATSGTLQVRLSASRHPEPPCALLSHPLHLHLLLRSKPVVVGFASSNANCSLFNWAFRANPYLMHSQPLNPTALSSLTTPPPPDRLPAAPPRYRYPSWVSLLFAAACGAVFTFILLLVWYSVGARRPVAPVEVEYPMRPSSSDIVYEKIVLVGAKDLPAAPAHK